jgi:eukaryotic-like serine/threonine-protein kinase
VNDEPDSFAKSFGEAISRQVHEELLESLSLDREGRRDRRSRDGADKPEGIVTIVFTDIVDSSVLVSTLGDQAARGRIRQHDDILREVVREHDGTEIERAGDGFMIAFSTASRAVAFAAELQRRFAQLAADEPPGLQVRIGMETGEVIAEEQGYFGRTVFLASRISDLATGGQVLVSQATRLIAAPSGFSFRDAGEHELKGLGGPHAVFEVAWRDGGTSDPALGEGAGRPELPPSG